MAAVVSTIVWQWDGTTPPGVPEINAFLRTAKHSAPGWDGIPFAAWRFGGPTALAIFHDLFETQMQGLAPPGRLDLRNTMPLFETQCRRLDFSDQKETAC